MSLLRPFVLLAFGAVTAFSATPAASGSMFSVSGIYPHLATFNNENECGTGAVVPWADRLWVISYAPHMPKGSSDKLYEIDVHTLTVTELYRHEALKEPFRRAELPGYHGKGLYSGQGLLVYANNGERGQAALTKPETPSGVLATWDGRADKWTVVRRNQFTDLTGTGTWVEYAAPEVAPGKSTVHSFPTGFQAYWLRNSTNTATTATAWLTYD